MMYRPTYSKTQLSSAKHTQLREREYACTRRVTRRQTRNSRDCPHTNAKYEAFSLLQGQFVVVTRKPSRRATKM